VNCQHQTLWLHDHVEHTTYSRSAWYGCFDRVLTRL